MRLEPKRERQDTGEALAAPGEYEPGRKVRLHLASREKPNRRAKNAIANRAVEQLTPEWDDRLGCRKIGYEFVAEGHGIQATESCQKSTNLRDPNGVPDAPGDATSPAD